MIPLALPPPLETDNGAGELAPNLTAEERVTNRDAYIEGSGSGISKVDGYVVSTSNGDKIVLKGGETGATFYGFFFWSKPKIAFDILDQHVRLSKEEALAYAAWDEASADDFNDAQEALQKIRKEMKDRYNINSVLEIDNISLVPGEIFTVKNREDYYAEKYFTERRGFIQWSIGFKVVQLSYNAGLDDNDEFGQEIEDAVDVKAFATKLYTILRPGQAPPTDFTVASEEEGGFQEQKGDPAIDLFGWWDDKAFPALKGLAKGALLVVAVVLFIYLLIVFRAPIRALIEHLTPMLIEMLKRE